MKNILIILLLLSNTTFAQYKYKAKYRPAPTRGETIVIIGTTVLGLSASGLLGHDTNLSKNVGFAGFAMVPLGVVIHLGDSDRNKKKKRKR